MVRDSSKAESLRSAAIALARTAALQWGLLDGLGIAEGVADALIGKSATSAGDLAEVPAIMQRRPSLCRNVLVANGHRVLLPQYRDLVTAPYTSPATRAHLALDDEIVCNLVLEELRTSQDTAENVAALAESEMGLRRRLTVWDLAEEDPTKYREQVGWDNTWGEVNVS